MPFSGARLAYRKPGNAGQDLIDPSSRPGLLPTSFRRQGCGVHDLCSSDRRPCDPAAFDPPPADDAGNALCQITEPNLYQGQGKADCTDPLCGGTGPGCAAQRGFASSHPFLRQCRPSWVAGPNYGDLVYGTDHAAKAARAFSGRYATFGAANRHSQPQNGCPGHPDGRRLRSIQACRASGEPGFHHRDRRTLEPHERPPLSLVR